MKYVPLRPSPHIAHWGVNDEYSTAGGDSGSKEPKDDDVIDDSDV